MICDYAKRVNNRCQVNKLGIHVALLEPFCASIQAYSTLSESLHTTLILYCLITCSVDDMRHVTSRSTSNYTWETEYMYVISTID